MQVCPFVRPSVLPSARPFLRPSVNIYHGCLVSATPLTIFYRSFWNFADVFFVVWGCACGLDINNYFLSLFPLCELSHFSTSMYRQWVACERNSSYNFIPILLKLCTWFLHGLKMCMWFGYNPCINFCYFFHFAYFVIFWPQILWKCCDRGYLVSATPHTILYRPFWNFVHVFAMVWRCAYDLDIILELIFVTFSTLWTLSFSDLRFYESQETVGTLWAQLLIQFYTDLYETLHMLLPCSGGICTWFGYNTWINFCHFFHFVNFVIFWHQILQKCGYLVSATPYTISCLSLCKFAHLFFHGLKVCMWFGFISAVNFCHFSTLLTLSFFAGATSTSPKFDLYSPGLAQIICLTTLLS